MAGVQLHRVMVGAVALAGMIWASAAAAAQAPQVGEWRAFGADAANTKYSPLEQITPENFTELEIAWRWRSISGEVAAELEAIRPGPFKTAPLMIGGLVYVSTALGQVAALDAGTGELVWSYDPRTYDRLDRPANMGWQHRGVSYWEDDESGDARIFIATHDLLLVAMNARTGRLYPDFGADGTVDLSGSLGRPIDRSRFTHSQPLAVVGDTVIVGSIVQDTSLTRREADPGHVRAFDARTGEMKWIFHTIPQGEEFGADTWHDESWRYSGHTNVWGTMAVDEELGYVYLPTGTPTNDWYGGMRPGDNLFAESIVAVDVETGQRVWHFQAVHHGLWDYDFPTAGNLVDIRVGGRDVKAIAQPSKQAFVYVFDRVTGEPVWPIEERPRSPPVRCRGSGTRRPSRSRRNPPRSTCRASPSTTSSTSPPSSARRPSASPGGRSSGPSSRRRRCGARAGPSSSRRAPAGASTGRAPPSTPRRGACSCRRRPGCARSSWSSTRPPPPSATSPTRGRSRCRGRRGCPS